MRLVFFILLMTSTSFAENPQQPEKENSSDLRTGIVMFKIESVEDKKIVWLERTHGLDYVIRMKTNENQEKIQKVTGQEAKRLDKEFATSFLKCQYELPASPSKCEVTLRLMMKGEEQNVCDKEDQKTQEIVPMLRRLEKHF
jgi:hypothetical protein